MKYEVLKRSHLKRNILIALLVVALISSLILNFTQAKYRTTESIPLIQGTINFSPSDFNMVAVYLNKGSETVSADKVPHVGYTLNEEQSSCESPDGVEDSIGIEYIQPSLTFSNVIKKGTKCSVYFDLIPDSEKPVINIINSKSDNDTSVTIEINATDNIGIYYYYYKLDNEEEIRIEENSYTFEELEKDSVHTITVRVEDAAGNVSETQSKEVTAGLTAKDVILVASKPQGQTTDWTGQTSYYYTRDNPNNWVYFANFYWRIIRINGDGTIRIIYAGTDYSITNDDKIGTSAFNSPSSHNKYVGYMYGSSSSDYNSTHTNTNPSTIKGILDTWYSKNLASHSDTIDGNAGFCGDRRVSSGTGIGITDTDYQPYIRIENNNPNLSCNPNDIYTAKESSAGNKTLTYPIGLISVDEAILAGIPNWNSSGNTNNYLYTGQNYWTMSPSEFDSTYGTAFVYFVHSSGTLHRGQVHSAENVRPVINIRSDVEITGSGTTSDPFVVVS